LISFDDRRNVPSRAREARFNRILEIAQQGGNVNATDLSRQLGVSEVSVRRDLRELAEKGVLHRWYGQAAYSRPGPEEPLAIQRLHENRIYKEAIGRAAANLIKDDESVFLGSGSTTVYVARNLSGRSKLTVVTNSLNIGMELAAMPNLTVVVLGGLLRPAELSLIGHITEQSLKEVRVDKVIIGIPAISLDHGLTNDFLPEVVTDRALINMSPELIIVADHTKFGKAGLAYVAPVSRITTLVTDDCVNETILSAISAMGIKIIQAETVHTPNDNCK
jgi:DeoR/GlpR family transcriptional regulator of sugar metabolism